MIHTKQAIVVAIAVLGASVAAFGQSEPRDRGVRDQAAIEAFGLTEEQVDQIREIRRERPPRDQDQEERQAWSDEQREKIQGVLTEEQKAKVAEAQAAAGQMRAFVAAARMGLTDVRRPGPDFRGARNRGPRGGRSFRSGQRGRGAAAFRRGGRGPGFRGRAKGPRGPQAWSPRGRRGGPAARRTDAAAVATETRERFRLLALQGKADGLTLLPCSTGRSRMGPPFHV